MATGREVSDGGLRDKDHPSQLLLASMASFSDLRDPGTIGIHFQTADWTNGTNYGTDWGKRCQPQDPLYQRLLPIAVCFSWIKEDP